MYKEMIHVCGLCFMHLHLLIICNLMLCRSLDQGQMGEGGYLPIPRHRFISTQWFTHLPSYVNPLSFLKVKLIKDHAKTDSHHF